MNIPRRPLGSVSSRIVGLMLLTSLIVTGSQYALAAQPAGTSATALQAQGDEGAPDCSLLDRPDIASQMSFGLEMRLAVQCGRVGKSLAALPNLGARIPTAPAAPLGVDVQENVNTSDPFPHYHQDESDLALGGSGGNIICSAYNDSATQTATYMGFSVSTDNGATFADRGAFTSSFGDPAMIYRQTDGFFYAASIGTSGLSLYKSTDGCQTFGAPTRIHRGASDDKPMMRVDNNPTSPFYGRMYVCFTNFNNIRAPIQVTWSSNGGTTWSRPVTASTGTNRQACWPAVAPNGDLYVVYLTGYTTGTNNIQMVRSTNGGVNFTAVTNIATGITEPGVSVNCGGSNRPTMNGNIRTWAMPQVAVAPSGRIHVAYTRKDGTDRGNIYYSHSDDNGTTWSAPVRINDDTTTNDQWHSTIAVNANGVVVISWYDRREAGTANLLFRRYAALSLDNGNTWQANVAVGDALSPVPQLNPNFDPGIASCYMGDYDAVAIDTVNAYIQWSDNRNLQSGIQQPDMFMDLLPLGPLSIPATQ